ECRTLMDTTELREILRFAVDAAKQAGELTLRYFQTRLEGITKADDLPVTIADRGAGELLRRRNPEAGAAHGILGEELGETAGKRRARWILDPIDGTVSFISGVPLYSVLVGFEWEGRMLAGVIHLPALRETVFAARGLGCQWNDRPARVSNVAGVSQPPPVHSRTKSISPPARG